MYCAYGAARDCTFGAAIFPSGAIFTFGERYAPSARDMCAIEFLRLITVTVSSSVKNFANEEYAHAKYLLLLLPSALRLPPTRLGQASAGFGYKQSTGLFA